MSESRADNIASVARSFRIVETIRGEDGITLSEIADRLDLAYSTVHNHLQTLEEFEYLVKNDGEYRLSLRFLHHGEYVKNRRENYDVIGREVERLADAVSEDAAFNVNEHGRIITVYHETNRRQDRSFQIGGYFGIHCTASGKAILAEFSDERVHEILDSRGMPEQTEHTITERDDLFEELDRIRSDGFSVSDQELTDGYRSIGAVVKNDEGDIHGAISVGGPSYRLDVDQMVNDLPEIIFDTVERIESRF